MSVGAITASIDYLNNCSIHRVT